MSKVHLKKKKEEEKTFENHEFKECYCSLFGFFILEDIFPLYKISIL